MSGLFEALCTIAMVVVFIALYEFLTYVYRFVKAFERLVNHMAGEPNKYEDPYKKRMTGKVN